MLRLSTDNAGQPVDQSHGLHLQESLAERTHVTEVSAGNNDQVRNFPVKLLAKLETDGLLAFDAQRVHRVGQVNIVAAGDLFDDLHAPVEIRIDRKCNGAVRQRLHQLSIGDFVLGKEHDRRYSRRRTVTRRCRLLRRRQQREYFSLRGASVSPC